MAKPDADSLVPMKTHVKTDRLILREWCEEDRKPFARMNGDPIVMEFLPRSLDEKASNKLVDRFQRHFDEHGYGLYAVEVAETGQFAGFVGLNNVAFEAPFVPATEIAWRLDYEFWGKGLGSEAAQAVLEHGLKTLKLKEIVSFTVHDNTRSIHLMEKIGLERDEAADFDFPALRKGHPLGRFVLYRS